MIEQTHIYYSYRSCIMVYKLSLCLCLLSVLCTASTIPMEYRSQPSEYRQEYGQAVSIVKMLSF